MPPSKIMNQRFHQALNRIGIQKIIRPVFYNSPQCLRFEIGVEQSTQRKYLAAALQRAEALYFDLPNPPDILRIDFCTDEDPLETFLEKSKLPPPQETIPGQSILHLYWNLPHPDVSIKNLLSEILRADFGGIWQLASSTFFMDTHTATLFYLYDDRGADLASADINYLRHLYKKRSHWILEYDRKAMQKMLKEARKS